MIASYRLLLDTSIAHGTQERCERFDSDPATSEHILPVACELLGAAPQSYSFENPLFGRADVPLDADTLDELRIVRVNAREPGERTGCVRRVDGDAKVFVGIPERESFVAKLPASAQERRLGLVARDGDYQMVHAFLVEGVLVNLIAQLWRQA